MAKSLKLTRVKDVMREINETELYLIAENIVSYNKDESGNTKIICVRTSGQAITTIYIVSETVAEIHELINS
nr:hypothetical protein [uncultured Sphingobacterium sp.]